MDTRRVALVTGGSRGLGAETVLRLSASGYRVALNYHCSHEEALRVVARASGPDIIMLRGDVSKPLDAIHMAHVLCRSWGRLDVLVNNAGISRNSLLLRTTQEEWDAHMRVNLNGAFNMIRAFATLMASSGGGHIVNISSRSGLRGKTGQAAYSASKSALIGLTLSAARELASDGIRVNAVLPGYMDTDMGLSSPEAMEAARRRSLTGNLGATEDIVSFVDWLSGTETVTGQVFSIDTRIG